MQADIATNSLIDENDVFADIANVNLFNGEEIISPTDISPAAIVGYYREAGGKQHKIIRDTAKEISKLHGCIVFMSFESQSGVSNIMPIRSMGYVYTSYSKQVNDFIAENRKKQRYAFTKEIHDDQKLKPVVTYVLYFGEEKWERPLCIMDMLDIKQEDRTFWEQLIEDYHIKVIHMSNQPEEVRDKYKSDFKIIADYLACRYDREKMKQIVYGNTKKLIHVEQVLDLLRVLSNDKKYEYMKQQYILMDEREKEENSNMCLLMDIAEEEGMKKGLEKGLNLGGLICKTLKSGISNTREIAESCNCTIEEVEAVKEIFDF